MGVFLVRRAPAPTRCAHGKIAVDRLSLLADLTERIHG
jgi:hypothetical protein